LATISVGCGTKKFFRTPALAWFTSARRPIPTRDYSVLFREACGEASQAQFHGFTVDFAP